MIIRFTILPSGFINREFSTNCLLFLIKHDTYKKPTNKKSSPKIELDEKIL